MSDKPGSNRPAWSAESQYPDLCEELRKRLGEIIDPELGYSIIQLGLVRDIQIEENQAVVNMILTTPFCPYGPSMLESTRAKAEEVLKRPTVMDFGLEEWTYSMMEEDIDPSWGLY